MLVGLFTHLALRFCAAYFPLDTTLVGGPSDFESNSALAWLVARALGHHGELPLWNPHAYTGLPFIGTPYVGIFNPFVVVPLLIWGPVDGPKMVAVSAVTLAGLGQYWLSRVLGQGRVVSLVAGILGLSAGALVARMSSGMSFEQGMQHAWMAASLASFVLALRRPAPGPVAVAAVCYALMFHSGNLYYWLALGLVLGLFALGYAVRWTGAPRPGLRFGPLWLDWRPLGAAGAVAGLTFLLVAVQTLPMIDLGARVEKPLDVNIQASQPPIPTLLNFLVTDRRFWADGLFGASNLGWGVHYAYLGWGLFLFLILLVPALRARPTRDLPLLLVGIALTVSLAVDQAHPRLRAVAPLRAGAPVPLLGRNGGRDDCPAYPPLPRRSRLPLAGPRPRRP